MVSRGPTVDRSRFPWSLVVLRYISRVFRGLDSFVVLQYVNLSRSPWCGVLAQNRSRFSWSGGLPGLFGILMGVLAASREPLLLFLGGPWRALGPTPLLGASCTRAPLGASWPARGSEKYMVMNTLKTLSFLGRVGPARAPT